MAEQKGIRKKTSTASDVARPVQETVGELLRNARLQQGLTIEGVSGAINIRAAQLRAIEDGNLDSLPGMTYALGFVRSYATYLKLNSAEIVHKFKVEHGNARATQQPLHYPEPLAEGHQPNWIMIGFAVLCVAILLGAWAMFSGGNDVKVEAAEHIPEAPAVGTMTGITDTSSGSSLSTLSGGNLLDTPPVSQIASVTPSPVAAPVQAAAPTEGEKASAAASDTPKAAESEKAETKPAPSPSEDAAPVKTPASVTAAASADGDDAVEVKRGKSRITLVSTQATWVEVKDASQKTILKKVLRPGDKYFVPDAKGLTMLTANAGGLEIYVDGKQVQSLGKSGEIVRGVELDASELKKVKTRTRN